jgi:hypothetical protein
MNRTEKINWLDERLWELASETDGESIWHLSDYADDDAAFAWAAPLEFHVQADVIQTDRETLYSPAEYAASWTCAIVVNDATIAEVDGDHDDATAGGESLWAKVLEVLGV